MQKRRQGQRERHIKVISSIKLITKEIRVSLVAYQGFSAECPASLQAQFNMHF